MPTYEYRCKDCGEHLEIVAVVPRRPADRVPRPARERSRRCSSPSASPSRAPASTATTPGRVVVVLVDVRVVDRPSRVVRLGSSSTSSDGGDSSDPASTSSSTRPRARLDVVGLGVEARPHRRRGQVGVTATAGDITADIGVYGGSGLYSLLDDVEEVAVDTPYGPPAAPVTIGEVAGRRVAFLPRHGRDHSLPPHKVPYRANAWALRSLGVKAIFGPCASGSLQPDIAPGRVRRARPDRRPHRRAGPRPSTTGRAAPRASRPSTT